jgi:hypothetical protein
MCIHKSISDKNFDYEKKFTKSFFKKFGKKILKKNSKKVFEKPKFSTLVERGGREGKGGGGGMGRVGGES